MITRRIATAEILDLRTAVNKTINTSGYKSAKVVLDVQTIAGNSGSTNVQIADQNGKSLQMLSKIENLDSIRISPAYVGDEHSEYTIDLSKVSSIVVTSTSNIPISKATLEIYFSYDEIDVNDYNNDFVTLRRLVSSPVEQTFDVKGRYSKLSFSHEADGGNYIIDIKGKAVGADTYTSMKYIGTDNKLHTEGYIQFNDSSDIIICTEGYESIQVSVRGAYAVSKRLFVSCIFLEDIKRTYDLTKDALLKTIGKARYVKVYFKDYYNSIYKYKIDVSGKDGEINVTPKLLDRCGNILAGCQKSDARFIDDKFTMQLLGERVNGGYILDFGKPVSVDAVWVAYETTSNILSGTPQSSGKVYLDTSIEEMSYDESKESLVRSNNKYDIMAYDGEEQIVDALGEDILTKVGDNLYRYYRNGLNGWSYDIPINSTYIPSLMSGETVKKVILVKDDSQMINENFNRICLFTNKNRILYNFIKMYYINYFREAPLYNSEKKWHPTDSKSNVGANFKYLPIFPDYNYSQFANRVGDGTQKDVFDVALPKKVSDNGYMLEDFHRDNTIHFLADSNFVRSKFYGTVWGMYNIQDGDPCLVATSNGKEWTIVRWFASVEDFDMEQVTTLKVDLSPIIANAGGYTSGSLKVTQRKYVVPSAENKEPASEFELGGSASITSIDVSNGETIITVDNDELLMTDAKTSLQFKILSPIVFLENVSASSEYNYICNNGVADGSSNNGIFFRLKWIAKNKFKMFGNVGNPYQGKYVCRHIHSVSEYQSGFLIATGENYRMREGVSNVFEGGFIYLLTANNRNNSLPNKYDHTNVKESYMYLEPTRLTSSENGVNRACGAYLMSDKDNTLLYVSDDLTHAKTLKIDGRNTSFNLNNHGVLKVALNDIDDFNKTYCVANTYNPAIGLTENNGRFAVSQFAGNAIFSSDYGNTWHEEVLPSVLKGMYYGSNSASVNGTLDDGSFFYGNVIIRFK